MNKYMLMFLLVGSNGCSIVGMTPPQLPSNMPSNTDEQCTSSTGKPIADALIAIGMGGATGLAVVNTQTATVQSTGNATQDKTNILQANIINYGLAIGAGIMTTIYGASSVYGFVSAGQCAKAKEEYTHQLELALKEKETISEEQDNLKNQQVILEQQLSCEKQRTNKKQDNYKYDIDLEECNQIVDNSKFIDCLDLVEKKYARPNCTCDLKEAEQKDMPLCSVIAVASFDGKDFHYLDQ